MTKKPLNDCDNKILVQNALSAMKNAYCPYSDYKVGAAVLTESGKIYSACNVENSCYGASSCAERNAVFKAVSEGEKRIIAAAIVSEAGKEPAYPCGICRQVLSEFCSPDAQIIVFPGEGEAEIFLLKELLPYSFNFKRQGKEK